MLWLLTSTSLETLSAKVVYGFSVWVEVVSRKWGEELWVEWKDSDQSDYIVSAN